MAKIINDLFQSSFLRNLTVIMSATALSQAFGLAIMPVIGRLYSPADFGIFGSFNAVVAVIYAGVTLQYSQALMLPKGESEAINILALSLLSVLCVTGGCVLVSFLFPNAILRLFRAPDIRYLLWILPLAVFINGVNQTLQAWCIRRQAFKMTAASQVFRTIAAKGTQAAAGFTGIGSIGLVGGMMLGDVMANISLSRLYSLSAWKEIFSDLNWASMKRLAREYFDFPIYSTPQYIINAASQGLPVLLLVHFFGAVVAGYYTVGVLLTEAPANLVVGPLRQVLFQKASDTYNQGLRLLPLFIKTTGGLFAIAILPAVIGFIWAPSFFSWFLGEKWEIAGEYSRWLVLWSLPAFCNVPSVLLARILRQQRNTIILEIVTLVSRVLVLILGGMYFSPLGTIILFSAVGIIMNIFLITFIWSLIVSEDRQRANI